jgi:ubiquinone/menaquinone biosynthesis C-methylase UbiE
MKTSDREKQSDYYQSTAQHYDAMHLSKKDEHYFALSYMVGLLDFFEIKSILDIGSGTGRALTFIKEKRPDIKIVGVEPVSALREIGHKKGIKEQELISGDALALDFENNSFDLVCEFGVLHHIKENDRVVAEMLRVADKCIFISDNNIYGDGKASRRYIKQFLRYLNLYKIAYFLQTKGKMYTESEADGIAYHYSVFDSYKKIEESCSSVHILNTNIWTPFNKSLFRTASHIALIGALKKP